MATPLSWSRLQPVLEVSPCVRKRASEMCDRHLQVNVKILLRSDGKRNYQLVSRRFLEHSIF